MFRDQKIAVIVPAYKEAGLIAETILGIPDFVDLIVCVDDASPDETSNEVQRIEDPRIRLVTHEVNKGVGGAIITGHRVALAENCDIHVVMAGDNQMDPDFLPALLEPIIESGYGFTKGNRFYSIRGLEGMPKVRIFGNMFLTFLTKIASGCWHLRDPQNGYTAITSDSLKAVPLNKVSERYEFENDLLIWLNIADVRLKDVNIPSRYGQETSTLAISKFVPRVLKLLFTGFWSRVWIKYFVMDFSPIALFLVFGVIFGLASTLLLSWMIVNLLGEPQLSAGTVGAFIMLSGSSIAFLLIGMFLDIKATPK
jgi:glycosyltransferase involved in cell wall biosynthesis